MTMSAAIFFSRLNITGSCCAPTWPTIWLLWRRIARSILTWLIAGSRMNKIREITCRPNRTFPKKTVWITIVTRSQAVVAMIAAFFASVEKIKENLFSFSIFYIILMHGEVDEQGKINAVCAILSKQTPFLLERLQKHNLLKKRILWIEYYLLCMLKNISCKKKIQNWIECQPMTTIIKKCIFPSAFMIFTDTVTITMPANI